MPKRPEILMIGAAARQAGKTQFACEVLRRYAKTNRLVAVKVTPVAGPEDCCPRGGEGCGICDEMAGRYVIIEESSRDGAKDTSRLLVAGASKVLWLRSIRDALGEGIEAVLGQVPTNVGIVCESNSSRRVLEPGLFLVLKHEGGENFKDSCREVMHLADRICEFDGSSWDLSPKRVVFVDGEWSIRPKAGAVVLAGGKSSRMGQDKSLLRFQGQTLLERIVEQLQVIFDDIVVGGNEPERFGSLSVKAIPDQVPDQGPLMGIVSCLSESATDLNFVTGCDIPEMNQGLIEKMITQAEGFDVVMPRSGDGYLEPLFAVYRRSVLEPARAFLSEGKRKIADLLPRVRVGYVEMPGGDWYRNLNTIQDYLDELKRLEGR